MDQQLLNNQPLHPDPPQTDIRSFKYLFFAGIGLVILIFCILAILLTFNSQRSIQGNPTPTPIGGSGSSTSKEVATNPKDKENQADYTGDITMTFSYRISVDTVRFSLTPSTSGTLKQLTPTTISFKPDNYLQYSTMYTANIEWGDSEGIQKTYTWSFTTDAPTGEEGFTPQDAAVFQKIRLEADKANQERRKKFPFLTLLPYSTPQFRVEITSDDTIVITTFGKSTQEHTSYLEDGKRWLTNNGGNLSNITIQHVKEE